MNKTKKQNNIITLILIILISLFMSSCQEQNILQNEELENSKQLLENGGFSIEKAENTLSGYTETVIYYQESYEEYAQEISSILKDYQPKIRKFTQDSSYDLIIVISPR